MEASKKPTAELLQCARRRVAEIRLELEFWGEVLRRGGKRLVGDTGESDPDPESDPGNRRRRSHG